MEPKGAKESKKGIDINIDQIIDKLLSVKGSKPGKTVDLTENEIKSLCQKSTEIFMSQPILLELEAPLKICGISHKVMFTVNIMIFLDSLNMENSLLILIIYF